MNIITKSYPYPKCRDCKHSFKQGKVMYCNEFKIATVNISPRIDFDYYLETETARSYYNLCGPYAYSFVPINPQEHKHNKLTDKYTQK
jgi:hypothetical protein